MTLSDPASHFQQETKSAYTHGFESIYALEEVDVQTIRRIGSDSQKKAVQEVAPQKNPQLELLLGPRFQTAVYPFPFIFWLQTLAKGVQPTRMFCLLEAYDLSELITLVPRDVVEVRRASAERKAIWETEAKQQLNCADALKIFSESYLVPWIRSRGGIATEQELMERIYALSDMPEIADKIIRLLADALFDGGFPFASQLILLEPQLFASDAYVKKEYYKCVDLAMSYFYRRDSSYPIEQLCRLMQEENSSKWDGFAPEFIEKILRRSGQFCFYRGMVAAR